MALRYLWVTVSNFFRNRLLDNRAGIPVGFIKKEPIFAQGVVPFQGKIKNKQILSDGQAIEIRIIVSVQYPWPDR